MIRDRDRIYGAVLTRRLRAMGIRDKPTAPASPWQNGVAERLIGSVRRECLDHIIVLGEAHLRRTLRSYACYYNGDQNSSVIEQGCAESLARFSGPVSSIRAPSLADFITTTSEFRISVRGLANLGYMISDQTVGNVLQRHALPPAPERKRTTTWPVFIRTHLALLAGTDFFTAEVLTLRGLVTYYVLFFIRSVKEECLSKVILFGERSLRFALSEYVEHYHAERNHQGKDNVLLLPRNTSVRRTGHVQCRERLGGLLRYYHQEAA